MKTAFTTPLLVAMFLFFLLVGLVPPLIAQKTDSYLQTNHTVFNPAEPDSYALFDSAFYASDVFLLGETHGYATPQTLDLALLKHLNQRLNVRYYLAEMDMAQADLVNQYLATGDKPVLDSLFRGFLAQTMAGTSQWGNGQFYDKIVAIRAYNQTRPDSLRIRFLGVDWFQSKGRFVPGLMRQLMAQIPANAPTDSLLDSLRVAVARPDFSLGKLLPFTNRIRADYQTNPVKYVARFGEKLLVLRQVFEMLTYANLGLTRDDVAARLTQFLTTERHLQNEKLYGLWGYSHIFRAGVNGSPALAGLLQKAGRRVVTMPIMTKDSRMLLHRDHVPFMFRKAGKQFVEMTMLGSDGRVFGVEGFNALLPVTQPNQTTLIKLDAPGSPYLSKLALVKMGGVTGTKTSPDDATTTVTTDYFQYVFVVRNSPAVSLWAVATKTE